MCGMKIFMSDHFTHLAFLLRGNNPNVNIYCSEEQHERGGEIWNFIPSIMEMLGVQINLNLHIH